jgi:hypothetical protein
MIRVVCLQTAAVFWLGRGTISLGFSMYLGLFGVSDVRQTEIHTAKPLVPGPSAFEDEMAIDKLKLHKSPGIYRIPTERIKAGGRTIHYRDH